MQRGTSNLLGGLKQCFEGLISPRNCPESLNRFDISLGAILATAGVANKSNLELAQSAHSNPECLQTVLTLGTALIILRPSIETLKHQQYHYSILAIRL